MPKKSTDTNSSKTGSENGPDRGSPFEIAAFKELCQLGCDKSYLRSLLSSLEKESVQLPKRKMDPETGELRDTGEEWSMPLHSLDSWETALEGKTLEDLRRIAKKAKELMNDIRELKRTPLVREFVARGMIRSADLLHRVDFPYDSRFEGLLTLPELAKEVAGPQKYPDRTELLIKLIRHIRDRTGEYQDGLLAPILACLIPKGPVLNKRAWPMSKKSLYQWRKRHEMVD